MNRDEEKIKAATDYIAERGYYTGQLDVAFIDGAEWADEHPDLTWKDIEIIVNINKDTDNEESIIGVCKNEEHYKEVLKCFKDFKERKEK